MITGSMVALVTPMTPAGDLDWQALDALVDWHVAAGTHAIVAVGTTGESATLDVDEHCEVISRVVARSARRVPVIAGTGANATSEAIELTTAAREAGADACLLVTPYYNKPTQEGLYRHHMAIADAVDIPQILYNVPGRTAVDLLPATVARLAGHPRIVGLKDATGDLKRGAELLSLCSDSFLLYSGDDATAVDLMLLGARGNISVTANVAPAVMARVCESAMAGQADDARRLNATVESLHRLLFLESNPIPVKWALHAMGRITEGIRLPLTPLSEPHRKTLGAALRDCGLVNG